MRGVVFVPSDKLDILWLDRDFSMDHFSWKDLDVSPYGAARELPGGTFTSPPAGVALAPNRLDVFGLGLDYAVYHKTFDPTARIGTQWSPNWENLGGNLTSTPVVLSTAQNHIDLFGLGPDQGMLHRAWNGSAWSDWNELGGGFTSLPVVLPAASGAFDIFARGLDFMVYHANWKPNTVADWALIGGGLLAEPIAASAPAAVRAEAATFVFAAGADGAMWYARFDGKFWKPWASLGPAHAVTANKDAVTFASEPVVAAFFPQSDVVAGGGGGGVITTGGGASAGATGSGPPGPVALVSARTRVDVFAVGKDKALWHKWLDHNGWHGEKTADGNETGNWESAGGSFACAPSIFAPNRGRTIVTEPPVDVSMVVPHTDGTIHRWSYDGTTWQSLGNGTGLRYRLPSCYIFSVDTVQINNTRSRHNDTDLGTATLAIGKWPVQATSFNMGDLNNGTYHYDQRLTIGPVVVELCEPVMFVYSIVNSGNSDIAKLIASTMVKGAEDYANDQMKSLAAPDPSQAVVAGIAVVIEVGGGATLVGSLAGAAIAVVLDLLLGWVFTSCDGIVAADSVGYQKGRDIQDQIAIHGTQGKLNRTAHFLGSDAPGICENSDYTVISSITQS